MKKDYENPNVKIAFWDLKDVISNSNDLEIDLKRSRQIENEENDLNIGYMN